MEHSLFESEHSNKRKFERLFNERYVGDERDPRMLALARRHDKLQRGFWEACALEMVKDFEPDSEGDFERLQSIADSMETFVEVIHASTGAILSAIVNCKRFRAEFSSVDDPADVAYSMFLLGLMISYRYYDAYLEGRMYLETHEKWLQYFDHVPDLTADRVIELELYLLDTIFHRMETHIDDIVYLFELGFYGPPLENIVPGSINVVLERIIDTRRTEIYLEDSVVPDHDDDQVIPENSANISEYY